MESHTLARHLGMLVDKVETTQTVEQIVLHYAPPREIVAECSETRAGTLPGEGA